MRYKSDSLQIRFPLEFTINTVHRPTAELLSDLIDLPAAGRMAMIFTGEHSIREVIAFPKTASAVSLMDDSPSLASEEQLRELHIKVR